CVRFPGGQHTEEPILRGGQETVLGPGKPTSGPRFPSQPPRRHPGWACGLAGWHARLKLVQRPTRDIQELYRAGLQVSAPSTSQGTCLLSRYRSVSGASYQKESGINSIDPLERVALR